MHAHPAPEPTEVPVNLSQQPTDRRPLRVEFDREQNLLVVLDGAGELLTLTPAEAAGLAEDIGSVLDIEGWPS